MKVTQKVDYALKAMLDLSVHGLAGPVRSAAIAKRAAIPGKFLESILVDLRKAGLIQSRRGPEGGHRLARSPSRITVGEVREAIDGPLALAELRQPRRGSPADFTTQILRELWGEVEAAVERVLSGISLEDLQRRNEVRQGVQDFSI